MGARFEVYNVPADVAEFQDDGTHIEPGWYWQLWDPAAKCYVGPCEGPFKSEAEAVADAEGKRVTK